MPTRVMTTAAESVQSAIDVDSTRRTSPVDMWIGSRVRIKRTSRGMSQQELSKLLGMVGTTLPLLRQARNASMPICYSALPNR
jgi:hypothetical protein